MGFLSLADLLNHINVFPLFFIILPCIVFATTAANPRESSWACYYDQELETYLGDVYSVKWMENVDKAGCYCISCSDL